jgi:hypothetical protein
MINPFKMVILVTLGLLVGLFSSCTKEPERPMIISKLKNSAKLATVEFIVTKVVSAKDKNWFARDAYFFAETEASIKAGIDLEKLREEDVNIEGNKISLILPPVEILNFSYPAEGFVINEEYTDQSAFLKWNTIDVETKDDLFRQGETDIRASLNDLGIIKTAETNTRLLLRKILILSGFEEIYIEFKKGPDLLETPDKQLLKELSEFLNKNK